MTSTTPATERAVVPGLAGLSLALLSAVTFGTSGTFASSLIQAGWSPGSAVTVRICLGAVILTLPAVIQLRGRWHLLRRNTRAVATYGALAVVVPQLFYFQAVQTVSVGIGLLLEYLGILLVVGWVWLRHGQRPRRLTVGGGVLAIAGLVLVIDLTGDQTLDPVGVLWGLGAAFGLAAYFVMSASVDDEVPPLAMAWAGMTAAGSLLLLLSATRVLEVSAPRTDVVLADHRVSWVVPVIGLALVSTAVAYIAGISAARLLGARVASFVGLLEVLAAVLIAWVLLDEALSAAQIAGGVLIIGGVALVRVDELRDPGPAAATDDVSLTAALTPEPSPERHARPGAKRASRR